MTDPEPATPGSEEEIPDRIGRYEIRESIGRGATAEVYRGYDVGLQREVAVKIPRSHLVASKETANAFLAEARTLASLDHPNILPIYDLGRTDDGLCFLVCKLFDGQSLKARLARGKPAVAEAVEIIRCLAEALQHAHDKDLVHRDVKPDNILLDAAGRPVIADFDLALRPRDFGKGPTFVGTISYMSPEQARREGHRVDARTDVYSLGVVFYEMLTGRRPFESEDREDLLEQIKSRQPLPLRELDGSIPPELERICLKAVAKLPSQRYATAHDMAEDLRQFQMRAGASPAMETGEPRNVSTQVIQPATMVPRGLRAFGARDADCFLELLPGPRDRFGLPDSIRFWKDHIESTDPETAFRVGLMLGPTGSGKSSLLQAGVLPRLAGVRAVKIESSPDETESRLVKGLRKQYPGLPAQGDLAELVGWLRLGEGPTQTKKVVIILDQFEQWLHARREYGETELVAALRQCDGAHVQAVLLVRDDFSLAAARFLHELEVPIVEGVNFAPVDRFTPAHARKVLASFGRAYGALPPTALTPEQEAFLDQAVEQLTEEGVIVPVRLVLLTEAMKNRPWTAAALHEMGGARGSAVVFLEEALGDHAANPAHRHHHRTACAVLQALLPARGEKLKGVKRSAHKLCEAAGLAEQPSDFAAVMALLSGELRLITPVEGDEPGSAGAPAEFYQLTHDYLIAPLRLWLTQQQRATRRGRALLRLAEFSDDWNALPETRRLPGLWTWASIAGLTRRRDWTAPQRAMMHAARRHYLMRGAVCLIVGLLLFQGWRQVNQRQQADLLALHAADQVAQLRSAPIRNVPAIIAAMQEGWSECAPLVRAGLQETDLHPRQQRNLRLALLHDDPEQVEPLRRYMLSAARPDEFLILRQGLMPYRARLIEGLWKVVGSPRQEPGERLRAAGALAAYDPASPRWSNENVPISLREMNSPHAEREEYKPGIGDLVISLLIEENPLELTTWIDAFRPVRLQLLKPLQHAFLKPQVPHRGRLPAVILADYAADDPALLTDLLLDANPEQYPLIWPTFYQHRAQALARLHQEVDRPSDAVTAEADRAEIARRRAQAAVILVQLGHAQHAWSLLDLRADRSVRSNLVHLLAALRTDPHLLVARWRLERDGGVRQGLILSLGETDPDSIDPAQRRSLVAEWLDLYKDDPDPGLHAAIDWTLRQRWKHQADVLAIDDGLAGKARGERRWFVNTQRQTFTVIPGPVELPSASGKAGTRIVRSFAIGAKDVTVRQYQRFQKAHPSYSYPDFPVRYIEGPESPMIWLTWFDAAAYCRWLSEQEGLPEDEMCYPPLAQIKPGMKLPANYLSRTGYRLPTAAEWHYAVRAGTDTPRFFGVGDALVAQFGWYAGNAQAHVHPVGTLKPNGLGLFDAYGNVWQWSHDRAFRPEDADDREDATGVDNNEPRLILGGSFTDQSFQLSSDSFVPRRPIECHVNYGMRLARTVGNGQ